MRIARRLANARAHVQNARAGLRNAKTTWRIIRGKATKSELIGRRVELEAAKKIHTKALSEAAKAFLGLDPANQGPLGHVDREWQVYGAAKQVLKEIKNRVWKGRSLRAAAKAYVKAFEAREKVLDGLTDVNGLLRHLK